MLPKIDEKYDYECLALYLLSLPLCSGNQLGITRSVDNKPFKQELFQKTESPDWQSKHLELGVEVTLAISGSEASDMAFAETIFSKSNSHKETMQAIETKDKKGRFKGKCSDDKHGFTLIGPFPTNPLKDLQSALESKIKRSQNYTKLKNNWLFVFYFGVLADEEFFELINSLEDKQAFTEYLVCSVSNHNIHAFDSVNNRFYKDVVLKTPNEMQQKAVTEIKQFHQNDTNPITKKNP